MSIAHGVIESVARANVYAHFADAVSHAFVVAQVAFFCPAHPQFNNGSGLPVFQVFQPVIVNGRGFEAIVGHGTVKPSSLRRMSPASMARSQ